MIPALLALAHATELPGIPLAFSVTEDGRWALAEPLPARFVEAGVQPGWTLADVDGYAIDDPDALRRRVAAGPARTVQLRFDTPEGATVVVVPRGPLVQVEEIGVLPWPDGFAPAAVEWRATGAGALRIVDGSGVAWGLDPATGAQSRAAAGEAATRVAVPEVWWALSDAPWVVSRGGDLRVGDVASARASLPLPALLRGFQGDPGEFLAVPGDDGLTVLAVTWPRGTPELPVCVPDVPETCLVAGRRIAATLAGRPGGLEEARRALGVGCEGGVYRACVEAVALDDAGLADRAEACVAQDANACHAVARARLRAEPGAPGAVLVGVLEYACAVDAAGSLGERLRRLEDVGEGCAMLAAAFDALDVPDRALLSLDQACVLGRADACEEAGRRRKEAFALRTVRECEDEALPLPSACVQLGRLLQAGPVRATELDEFGAYLRACELGEEEGCVLLGDYVDRWGIAHPRVVAAEATLLDACGGGEQRACVGSAHLLVRHEPRSAEYGRALELFAAACDAGLSTACVAGAEQRRIGRARRVDAPEPLEMWATACDQQSAAGCAGLGERLARSRRTWDEAYAAWTRACDTGDAGACSDLGRLVENRHAPWPDEQPATAYLERGCENGDAEGCYWLAEDDVPRRGDPPEPAYLLLERSCDGAYGPACAALGGVHLDRRTSFDDEIAAEHLQSACDNGHFESCKRLSEMYQRGKGVEKDRLRARELAQRYSVNARRRHVRLGAHVGFPYVAGGEAEVVVPIPVGPALALTGSYSYLPGLGGVMLQLVGESYPADPPDLWYADAGARLYPNNKARGLYGMVAAHRMQAQGGELASPLTRTGVSARLGMYGEQGAFYTRVEMGIGQYGVVRLADFDDDETGEFPLIQATLGFSIGIALF